MSRRGRKTSPSSSPIIGVVLLIVIAAALWFAWEKQASRHKPLPPPVAATPDAATPDDTTKAPLAVSAERIDAANEGRTLSVEGRLRASKPARDTQLGVSADAVVLLRTVEMLQWREQCAASACEYALAWSAQPVDSSAFRERKGHENLARFPFVGARFVADEVRLGAFRLDAATAKALDAAESSAWPVHANQLPPNLAATFRERDGVLYAGAGPDQAAAGDLRVSYRIVAAGQQRLVGVQHGDRLLVASKK